MKFFFLYIGIIFFAFSCKTKNNTNVVLWSKIRSNNMDSIIDATLEIQETKNMSMINALLYQSFDPRITHRIRYNGMSIYEIKMLSVELLTGDKCPNPISYEPDSAVISYYLKYEKK
jgi:hypothetical protein